MCAEAKPKFAMYWAAACGGCEIAVLNTHEGILDVDNAFEVVFWPVAMDAKYADVEAMPEKSIAVCLFNGGIRNNENEAIAKLLRSKSQFLVAFGACACEGGIPGLGNLYSRESLIETAFRTSTTENPENLLPQTHYPVDGHDLHIPTLNQALKTLDQVVDVDYFMPGCPPESHQISAVISLLIKALRGQVELPQKRAVIGAGLSTVCDECTRHRGEKSISEFKRMATYQPDPQNCLLEQGILCNGIATRSGCLARCPAVNMPCIGCYGAAPGVIDQGARMISAIASVSNGNTHEEISTVLDGIVDPVGTFYRFSLANGLLRHSRPTEERS